MNAADRGTEKKKGKLYDIHCPSCGAPAYYDIKNRVYNCSYCGNKVGIDRAKSDRKGFREISQKKMKEALKNFELQKAGLMYVKEISSYRQKKSGESR